MRKGTRFNRFLSMLVCLTVLCGSAAVPVSVSATASAVSAGNADSNGVTLNWNKHVTDNGDGTYTMSFSAKTKISHTALNMDIYTAEKGYYEVPADGDYIIQAWGSEGGKGSDVNIAVVGENWKRGGAGGAAGYVEGMLSLKKGQKIAYTIGSKGSTTNTNGVGGGVNGDGGSHGNFGSYGVGGGGGYTAVYVYDENSNVTYNHSDNYKLIAGGGGGGGAGHRSQSKTPDGGAAGNMNTSAYAEVTAELNNGVAGIYYAGKNGESNSNDDKYVGYGATNLPGEANGSWLDVITATGGNDWLGTYNPDREGGLGGDGNGRGGAGGAGFAGGSGGVQATFISAWDCGGGGGGSSFIASDVKKVTESYRSHMVSENTSLTGGSVVIIPVIKDIDNISTLNNVTIEGEVSNYFDIVSGGTVSGKTFKFDNISIEPTMSADSAVATVEITVKPRNGFAGGNSVPLLESMKVSNSKYTFTVDKNDDTDCVNVPWNKKVTANTIYAEPGDVLNTSALYVDDNGRENVNRDDNYSFIKSISAYKVDGISGDTFKAPSETAKYTVSYTVEGNKTAAKVGTPVDVTVSAVAVVDVSGMQYVNVDGARNGYKKTLKYNSMDNTYDLEIKHEVTALEGVGSTVTYTDEIKEVGTYTTAGEATHTIAEDGYYLILLRGADGGQGGDTSISGWTVNHRHGYGGAGADGGYAYMIGKFKTGDNLNLQIGNSGKSAEYVIESNLGGGEISSDAGSYGGYTSVSYDKNCLAVAGGGGGGGGSFARQVVRGIDIRSHGYAAKQSIGFEVKNDLFSADESVATNGTNGSQSDVDGVIFAAGESGKSYVYAPYSVDSFKFTEDYYESIKTSDEFKEIINLEDIAAETSRNHACSTKDDNEAQPLASFTQEHKELTQLKDTAGVKIYKVTRTKKIDEFAGVRENLSISGEISKYFTINSVKVEGATAETPVINNGDGDSSSTFSINKVNVNNENYTATYTINLAPKDGFLGGNDVPVIDDGGICITRSGVTADTADDKGMLEVKNASDFANVKIADYEFNLVTHDKTIVKGESVNVSELYDEVKALPSDWTADYVKLKASLEGTDGAETISPSVTTDYILSVELASKNANEKAVVASPAESIKRSKPATVYVEYSVTYNVTNITPSNKANAKYHESYTTVLENGGYVLPDTITVTMGENTLTAGTEYTYDKSTGRVYIAENVVEDNIVITASATVKSYTLTYAVYDKDGKLSETKKVPYAIGDAIDHSWEKSYAEEANKSADVGYTFYWEWQTEDGKSLDKMPGYDVWVNGYYDKISYNLTVDYVYENGEKAAESYTGSYRWGDPYSVDSPVIEKFIADKATVSGTMPKSDVEVKVTYKALEAETYPLIIYYKYEDGTDAAASYSKSYKEGEGYSITSPSVKGYKPDNEVVSGTMGTKGITVTVTYKEDLKEVKVKFDANGGNLASGDETKTVYYGNGRTYGTLPTPVKGDSKFIGWYTSADGGEKITSSSEVTNSSDHTLYAHWEALTAAVVYDANGGKFENETTTVTINGKYGEAYPITDKIPERKGYKFTGWYTDASAVSKFETTGAKFAYTSPRTLYAGWELTDSARVEFKNGDVLIKGFDFEVTGTVTDDIVTPPTGGGYFKSWMDKDNSSDKLTIDYYKKKTDENKFTVKDTSGTDPFLKTYLANWYDESSLGKSCVSDAKAQAVTLSDGKKAIRFLALIDADFADYQKAGFVIATACPTPTAEAGYQYSVQNNIYKKIFAMKPDGSTGWLDIAYLSENTFSFAKGAGLLYANLTIKDGNEDKVYYATPYIINKDGEYVYGKTRAISYNELKKLDETVKRQ